ncbi:MAG: hypothetical protein KDJ41_10000 [Hyphomicrobiaceae bacterium]|nr:hypothetical protein [Hyphomicrobiaceae bacterium]
MIARAIGRLIWVPVSFVLAVAAGGFVLFTLGTERLTHAMRGRGADADLLSALFDLFRQGEHLVSTVTVVPAVLLVIIGEVARIRSSVYYVVGGGIAAAAVPFLGRLSQGGLSLTTDAVWQVFATAGFAAGLVYWALAGRKA